MEEQQERTRKKAEVFTPIWLCNKMNNYADEQWFGQKDIFNFENEAEHTWRSTKIRFHLMRKEHGDPMLTHGDWRLPVVKPHTWYPNMMRRLES